MCNWLVCMAVWLCTMAKDLSGKMVGVWFPISMFIAIGFEHSVGKHVHPPCWHLLRRPTQLGRHLGEESDPCHHWQRHCGGLCGGCWNVFRLWQAGQEGGEGYSYSIGSLMATTETAKRCAFFMNQKDPWTIKSEGRSKSFKTTSCEAKKQREGISRATLPGSMEKMAAIASLPNLKNFTCACDDCRCLAPCREIQKDCALAAKNHASHLL